MRIPLPVFLYDASAGQYALLADADYYDSESESEDGTLAGDEHASQSKSVLVTVDLESLLAEDASDPTFSWYRAVAGTIWYLRMCLLLVILCTAVTLATGLIFAIIGNLAFLGSFEPYATMKYGSAEFEACVVGAGVLGCAIGLLAFVHLIVRRVRMITKQRGVELADSALGLEESTTQDQTHEPEELWIALAVAALAGAFAMAVGMIVIPGFTTEAFGVRHALAIGAWGLGAPLSPVLASMFVTTLWNCDPLSGAECCCEGYGACCDSYSN